VYFTQMPQATISGGTAEVSFQVRLRRSGGRELLSGTWVCVVEDGEWKLDRLEDESIQPL
jgi:serine/threonine-protein kinase